MPSCPIACDTWRVASVTPNDSFERSIHFCTHRSPCPRNVFGISSASSRTAPYGDSYVAVASGDWKSAASHRAGWAFNNPLYACNWTPCYPIQPLRRSRNLPERGSFLEVDAPNVVVTAVAPSKDDTDAWIVRAVEYHGVGGRATLSFKRAIGDVRLVNFLERDKGAAAYSGSDVHIEVRPYGIHTLKIRFAP